MAVHLEEEINQLCSGDILTVLPETAPTADCTDLDPQETGRVLLRLAREHGVTGWFVGRTDDEVTMRLRDGTLARYPLSQVLFVFRRQVEHAE